MNAIVLSDQDYVKNVQIDENNKNQNFMLNSIE